MKKNPERSSRQLVNFFHLNCGEVRVTVCERELEQRRCRLGVLVLLGRGGVDGFDELHDCVVQLKSYMNNVRKYELQNF